MFKNINSIIDNEIRESNLDFYSVIVGTKPSMGARSPKLWNKVYNYEEKHVRMVPLDVREENLEELFNYLKRDKQCLGGAVAVPYKEKIFSSIKDNVDEEIKAIGAVNCFYRPASRAVTNDFIGTNTDGEAALEPIKKYLINNKNLSICLLGLGGAGKAILSFLLRDFRKKHRIQVFNRSNKDGKGRKSWGLDILSINALDAYIQDFDLLINATSVGHVENIHATPVSAELLTKAKKTMIVYDIIYDPINTTLLKNSQALGLSTINGLRMNLIQAVFAYSYTNQTALAKEEIYKIMN